ncbi:glycosyltransferase family 61 protein [Desulfovibrio sp. OttesenSCG-928-G15]|nr:glycosyltransferase family 61 protein [Desulfovibrio sp. OttesenSCG-928-G15]
MRHSHAAHIPEAFGKIFASPFTVQDYATAPELVALHHIAEPEPMSSCTSVRIFGREVSEENVPFRFSAVPEMYIAELEDVLLFNTVIHSKTGNFFRESARMYYPQNGSLFYNFAMGINGESFNPFPLGNSYYVHTRMPKDNTAARYPGCAMPFIANLTHYGHFLIECISRLWVIEHGFKPQLVLHSSVKQVPRYLLELVRPFGLDADDFIFSKEFSVFEKLILPSHALMEGCYIGAKAKSVYRKIAQYYGGEKAKFPAKIYVSREKLTKRRLINERQCREIFEKHGFTPIYPEELSTQDQINAFAHATHIAGPIGSGLHNVFFSLMPEDLSVLFLSPREFKGLTTFHFIESSYGRRSNLVMGEYLALEKSRRRWSAPWTLDPDDVEAAIPQWLTS